MKPGFEGFEGDQDTPNPQEWGPPQSLPDGLLPVADFDLDFLPAAVAQWVADIAERMSCPLDFVAIPAMVALCSVLGRRVALRPQRKNDWAVVPNQWGCIIGRPGTMKSPAMAEALKPLHWLEKAACEESEIAQAAYAREADLHKLQVEAARDAARKALKGGQKAGLPDIPEPEPRCGATPSMTQRTRR